MMPESGFDRSQAFLLFCTFTGDLTRTAAALGVRPVDVLAVSEAEGWAEKLKPILELANSNKPGDLEKSINRALNFVQSRRLLLVLERTLKRIADMSIEELEAYLFYGTNTKGDSVKKLSTRALADLASAIEKAQALTYLALADTTTDRVKRNEKENREVSGAEMHATIAAAMAKTRATNTPRGILFETQLEVAQVQTEAAKLPVNPNDNDDH